MLAYYLGIRIRFRPWKMKHCARPDSPLSLFLTLANRSSRGRSLSQPPQQKTTPRATSEQPIFRRKLTATTHCPLKYFATTINSQLKFHLLLPILILLHKAVVFFAWSVNLIAKTRCFSCFWREARLQVVEECEHGALLDDLAKTIGVVKIGGRWLSVPNFQPKNFEASVRSCDSECHTETN